ncbi:GNAT family N-acetyltransferase [Polynucleobacter necessarius]|uniref:GNAT family N-acetyltransferase n=1 Tax=Polynucleobacter necessarius TaxID=576610 RepID=UPI000E0920AC|nr:GNAT family N-acetyltransferase [Polynucleobacter necessarius]
MMKFINATSQTHMELVRELFREYAGAIGVDLAYQDFEQELALLPGKYAEPKGLIILLAYVDDQLAGCVAVRQVALTQCPKACEMKRLYVRPQYRNLQIGKHLVDLITPHAKTAGYSCLLLDTLPTMEKAISLYERLGFMKIKPYYESPVIGTTYFKLGISNQAS